MKDQYILVIDYVPGQAWEAHFEGEEPTLGTGGFGWEAQDPQSLLSSVAEALTERMSRS